MTVILLLILAFVFLFVGVGALGGTITAFVSGGYHAGDVGGLILISAIGIACLSLGLFLLRKSLRGLKARRAQREAGLQPRRERKKMGKKARIVLICVGVYVLLIVSGVGIRLWNESQQEKDLERFIYPQMRSEFSATGVSLPDDPHYVVYDTEEGGCIARPGSFPKQDYTNKIKQANTVVYCQKGLEDIGYWTAAGSMTPIADACAEVYTVSIVRLEDWALVAEREFSYEGYESHLEGYTYTIELNDAEIGRFLDEYLD